MFNLIKMNGTRINVPEFTTAAIDSDTTYRKGCVYYNVSGILLTSYNEINDLIFIPVEDLDAGSQRTTIKGFYVTDDMIFETDFVGSLGLATVGATISFSEDDDSVRYAVCGTLGDDVKLLNIDSLNENGKVLVALKW